MLVENSYKRKLESSDSSSVSSEEEEESIQEKSKNTRVSVKFFIENTVQKYSNEEFKQHFRISRCTAYKLISKIRES